MEREKFSSRLGFLLVSAGCAIGLGNVWKFPYICGENGGAAFIVIYLLCLAVIGLPVLICEFAIGRGSKRSVAMAFDTLEGENKGFHKFKWFCIAGNYLLMMFYTMVGGWMLYYTYQSISGKFAGLQPEQISDNFDSLLSSPGTLILWTIIAIGVAFFICALGLKNGVEKVTKIMMLLLIVLMCVLAAHSLLLENSGKGIRFYLVPDFSKIKDIGLGNAVFAAMTHAFFTLSVGMGSMEIFGSYLDDKHTLSSESIRIVLLDTFVALTAGFIIIPACFAYNIQPDAGPSLLFITLPNVFNHMAGGRIWGSAFFVFMSFAALSTIIAVFENIIMITVELTNFDRKKAVLVNFLAVTVLSLPAILGYNVLSGIHPFGGTSNLMDLEDFLVSYNILPLGALIFVLFCMKKNGWGAKNFVEEANKGVGAKFPKFLVGYLTYVLPIIIVIIYLKGYYDMFAAKSTYALAGWMAFAVLLLGFIMWTIFGKTAKKSKVSAQ